MGPHTHISHSWGLAVGPAATSSREEPVLPCSLAGALAGTRLARLRASSKNKMPFQFFLFRGENANFLDFYKKFFSAFLQTTLLAQTHALQPWVHKSIFLG